MTYRKASVKALTIVFSGLALTGYLPAPPSGSVLAPAAQAASMVTTASNPIASPYASSWAGQTFNGISIYPPVKNGNVDPSTAYSRVPQAIQGMAVSPDGTVYTNADWDELASPVSLFKNGAFVASASEGLLYPWCQSFGNYGSTAIAVNSTFTYAVHNSSGHFVMARTFVGDQVRTPAFWKDGIDVPKPYNPCEGSGYWNGVWMVDLGTTEPRSAAANDSIVAVSFGSGNQIQVYAQDVVNNTFALRNTFSVSNPNQMAIDGNSGIWVVQNGATASQPSTIHHYDSSGNPLPRVGLPTVISGIADPQGIAIDPTTGHLLVVDAGPNQQVLIYNVASMTRQPIQIGVIGTPGGMRAGGAMTPPGTPSTKLISPNGVGVDAAGNVYVTSISPPDIRAYQPWVTNLCGQVAWNLLWEVDDVGYPTNAIADATTDGADVYTITEHFTMDYTKTNGYEWRWAGHTLDAVDYPQDPRNQSNYQPLAVRKLGGTRFLYSSDDNQNLAIYRLNGEVAVPAGFVSTSIWVPSGITGIKPLPAPWGGSMNPMWIWTDAASTSASNGDGQFALSEVTVSSTVSMGDWDVDSKANLWLFNYNNFQYSYKAGWPQNIVELPLQGLNGVGNPEYSPNTAIVYAVPSEFLFMTRGQYIAETDTMYISGYAQGTPFLYLNATPQPAGNQIARYDHWSTQTQHKASWVAPLAATPGVKAAPGQPQVYSFGYVDTWHVAGNRVFAGYMAGSTNPAGNKVPGGTVDVYDATTGAFLNSLLPGANIGGGIGWMDIRYAVRAFQRANGEYVVFAEDDGFRRIVVYRGDMNWRACKTGGGS